MKPKFFAAVFVIILTIILLATGCDDPNTPDVPNPPYHLAGSYVTRGQALGVDASGDLAAVADDRYGSVLLDVSDLAAIDSIWKFENFTAGVGIYRTVLDPIHNLIGSRTDGVADGFPVYNYVTDAFTFSINLGSSREVRDIAYITSPDSINIFAIDANDGLVATRFCRANSESPWQFGCGLNWTVWRPLRNDIRGFSHRADNMIAVAIAEEGLHIHDATLAASVSDLQLPGVAYDCAWYGNYIIVAAQYHVLVVDATTLSTPTLVATLNISGADRMQHIVIQGNLATVMDINDGLYMIDLGDVLHPRLVQSIALIDPTGMDAEPLGNRLYVTDRALGLLIYEK